VSSSEPSIFDQEPKPKFPFDDRPIADYDEGDDKCPVCTILLSVHSLKQIVECALMEIRYPKNSAKEVRTKS